ncbi:MAG TPA: hypothetical protein VG939_03415 [Caulobacteraceae bacterium]|nr:hypothetical protein [Caulobacteraceae bacterium]
MKIKSASLVVATIAGGILWSSLASAEPYVDYTPQKGVWHVTSVRVDPNHIDDYVTGLKKTWVTAEEIAKRHGLIDSYSIKIKLNASDGQANVLLIEHYPSLASLEPDQARDEAMQRENYAAVPKETGQQMVAGYDKYRVFVGDDYWTDITFPK